MGMQQRSMAHMADDMLGAVSTSVGRERTVLAAAYSDEASSGIQHFQTEMRSLRHDSIPVIKPYHSRPIRTPGVQAYIAGNLAWRAPGRSRLAFPAQH